MNEKITETDAKQGRNDKRVLTVLVAGIALRLLAFGMVEFFQGTAHTTS